VLIDAMFPAALAQARDFAQPTAVFVHTFVFRQLDMWRKMIATLDGMRQQAGFAGLPPLDDLWRPNERIISTSLSAFDAAALPGWDMLRHAGPVLEDEKFAVPTVLPWTEDDKTPLVLVSFSTGFEQRNVDKVQRTLDALADLPVHVVATTGGIVAPNEVAAPANAIVLNYAAHDPILRRAALVVTHPRTCRRSALRRRSGAGIWRRTRAAGRRHGRSDPRRRERDSRNAILPGQCAAAFRFARGRRRRRKCRR
jgi:hypothetical protein